MRDLRREESGFTLVELVVVILVMIILLSIAVITFLGARRAAQDRAAQSLAREALASAKTLFQFGENYSSASVTQLRTSEPNINFLPDGQASTGPGEVSTDVPVSHTFVAAVYSRTGTCFYIQDSAQAGSGGTTYASKDSGVTDCVAADISGLTFTTNW